ncbi:MAG: cyclic nucleotide-binding domain-containing protein [Cyanobium sp.]
MQVISTWPERQARLLRWFLLAGWLLLILSLLWPVLTLPDGLVPPCPPQAVACSRHQLPGNRLFWGTVVPAAVLLIVTISHEIWRRICPLAFVSQMFRALGLQRTRPGRGGRPEVVKVSPDSWLGRHHLQLQWSLLIAGLCLRLLVVNSSPHGLALLLIGTLLAALLVGWAYGGKAWCQYVCPMAPVQAVLTGPRGPLGSTAHLGARSRITQSMCRTVGDSGKEQSACIACQSPCLDIDAERAYWQTLNTRRGFAWAWYSYPGLVLAFFLLMAWSGPAGSGQSFDLVYLRSGLWAFDAGLPGRSLAAISEGLPMPRLVAVPLLLALAGGLSAMLFFAVERRLRPTPGVPDSPAAQLLQQRATSRTRLLATFLAANIFFWFVDPSQGMLGPHGGQLIRSLVLTASAIWLFRGWSRDAAVYRRESTSESLRKQLTDLPDLQEALDGRSLQDLSPQEVFTLAKALPALGQQRAQQAYRDVLAEMLRSGRLERAQSLLQLQDLRDVLDLREEDHHNALRLLVQEQPDLLELDWKDLQALDLRREAAAEAIEALMAAAGLEVLEPERLRPEVRQQLEQVRVGSALEQAAWQDLLISFGPRGEEQQERLAFERDLWDVDAGLLRALEQAGASEPLYLPLARTMALRLEEMGTRLTPRLEAAGLPPLGEMPGAVGSLAEALDLLWQDPDADTAGWVLLIERLLDPPAAVRRLSVPRSMQNTSEFLQSLRIGDPAPQDLEQFRALSGAALFSDLLPASLVWLKRLGRPEAFAAAEVVLQQGDGSDDFSIVISGSAELQLADGRLVVVGPGETLGEMGVISGERRSRTVHAGPKGVRLITLPAYSFDALLQRSRAFSRALLRELSQRLRQS